jgi:ribosome-binding protein aMBF1 (putative translation factor)
MKSMQEANTFEELMENFYTEEERAEIDFQADLICKCAAARRNRGLSQKQLAAKSGLKQPAIARIESLSTSPRVDTLVKILYHLGYKLEIVPIDKPSKA